ncbi:MAG: cytidylate kinase-like family protein [Desulfobacteraceae bacterium]|nr:cytidylate kinase-like family protein [Desulfobacteraceae bacterium]
MPVITISRQFGAGGRTLGKMISEKLQYTFADTEIIQKIAKEANVSPEFVESVEKEAGTKLSKVINSMVSMKWVDRILADERGYIDEQIYLDYLVLIIAQVADEGNVVVLGRGSQYILNDHPDAFHVLLIDNVDNRIKFMMDNYDLPKNKAAQVVTYEDKRRLNLYKKLGKTDYDDSSLYHLVLNMSRMTIPKAMNLIETLIDSK